MRTKKLVLTICILLFLPGCWNRTELNELWVASATGLDYRDGGWEITYQIIVPSAIASSMGSTSQAAATHSFTVKAKTIHQALTYSNLETSRRIYVSHNRVIFIGKKAAEKGLEQLVDFFFRNSEARETVLMLFTEGYASDMLKKLVPPEKIAGTALAELLSKEHRLVSVFPRTSVYDFALSLHSDGKGIGMPVATLTGDNDKQKQKELESLDITKKTSTEIKISLSKLAVFQEGRFAGFVSRRESLGLSWLTDKVRNTEVSYSCGGERNQPGLSALRINKSKTKLNPSYNGSRYTMHVKVKIDGSLTEAGCKTDLTKPGEVEKLEKQAEQEIGQIIAEGWRGIQRVGVDSVGFGDIIHRKFKSNWKDIEQQWPDEFKKMNIDVRVEASIRRPGQLQKSFELRTDE